MLEILSKIFKSKLLNSRILCVYLAVFFLFNTGVIFELSGEKSESIALNNNFDSPKYSDEEVSQANWLKSYRTEDIAIYSDIYRGLLLSSMGIQSWRCIEKDNNPTDEAYVFLGTRNEKMQELSIKVMEGPRPIIQTFKYIEIGVNKVLWDSSRIYDCGFSDINYLARGNSI